jgi:signal transduction histidine kinase/CheY-like chemotaxis protein/HAMP domain-containing protein
VSRDPAKAAPRRLSIRLRLWLALTLLAGATVLVGAVSWYALGRADAKLEVLHRQTLSEVARALTLSKRSTDLATSAPFLLGLKSPYLIRSEGADLLAAIEHIGQQWPAAGAAPSDGFSFEQDISEPLVQIKYALSNLIEAADRLDKQRDKTLRLRVQLAAMDRAYLQKASAADIPGARRKAWVALQEIANALIGAVHVENLPGLGEYQRRYVSLALATDATGLDVPERAALADLRALADGKDGIFSIRRKELDQNLLAQKALFRIRYNAGRISDLALVQAQKAEEFLARKRQETSSFINYTRLVILGVGLVSVSVALVSALFVSGYVTGNIKAISDAMQRLAQGDRSFNLPRPKGGVDEIGKLLQSFRVFRANALRLDRSNRQLHQKNTLFEKIFANIMDGVAIIDDEGRLTGVNPSFAHVLHLPAGAVSRSSTVAQVLAASPFGAAADKRKLGRKFRKFSELHSEDGDVLEVRCNRLPDGGEVWLFSDATERHRIDERLGQIRRIESLGKVTGEVAHDFANILSTISGNLHLLETKPVGADTSALRRRIAGAVEIGTSMTQRLLAFARKQRLEPELTELNTLVAGLEDLVSIGLKDAVVLSTQFSDRQLFVRVDPGQLESAILNLCLNSNQAIEGVGEIMVSVAPGPAGTAEIRIEDNGCGMEKSVLKRAMEPFYTARRDGEGTGLGLSSVYGFIKQSGGEFQIDSTPGLGTKLRLSLPLATADAPAQIGAPQTAVHILLVEDEAAIMAHTAGVLRDLGHRVREAGTFQQARQLLAEGGDFDAVLTDIHLDNGNSGWQLVEQCLADADQGGLRIIVTSGRMPGEDLVARRYGDKVICLPKPLTPETLRAALSTPLAAE